ncbi:FtsX-like permease family protein [Streptomyces sp. NPDC048718]|uniref:FtsX-like permease family protein n=1 Tax=Streptomyces sp. NPDC048718 TaxID=3365587 RepID=UPI003721345C
MPRKPARTVAPWVRTRLRTAPGAAFAYGLLVLVTAFLAASLPWTTDGYETDGLRHAISAAPAHRATMTISTRAASSLGVEAQASELSPDSLLRKRDKLAPLLPDPLRVDRADSVYGAHTTKRVPALDPWLPQRDHVPPQLLLDAPTGLADHARYVSGRAPKRGADGGMEAVVSEKTAKALGIKTGSVVHVAGTDGEPKAITITGIVRPLDAKRPFWTVETQLETPAYLATGGAEPAWYWAAALIMGPESAPQLAGTLGEPEQYWRFAPAANELTARDADRLAGVLDSLGAGPGLVKIREVLGDNGGFHTDLDDVITGFRDMRGSIASVVAVAVFGVGAVAAVVLIMTGGLFTARRHPELALLRSRGASLPGIGVRLLGETAAVTVPASVLGLLLAYGFTGASPDRIGPSCVAVGAVALLGCLVVPLRAMFLHRRPQLHSARDDLINAKPSRRRTVAELTFLVLAVGAVTALRRRGVDTPGAGSGTSTGSGGAADPGSGSVDYLVSAAPVLVALIAAFVLVRLYPLPLRWAARPARRLRGVVGYLSLARAGRSSATGALPLLALLVALTTAAFGGSVLTGISDARDKAAYLATGADARVESGVAFSPLPPKVETTVRAFPGVREVSPVQVEYGVDLPARPGINDNGMGAPLVGIDPATYARLAERTGFGAFPADLLKSTGTGGGKAVGDNERVVPVIASPRVADRLGDKPMEITAAAGRFHVKVVAVREVTPALPDKDFFLVNLADLVNQAPTALLVTGGKDGALDGEGLRTTVLASSKSAHVELAAEKRAGSVDSPLQTGAEGLYLVAIAAGAGYAVLALLIALFQVAPERTTLLARLRTMGLTRSQGRRLLALEALPQAAPAAVGGIVVGWVTIRLLSPGVDLTRLALAGAPEEAAALGTALRADAWTLGLPAAGVVVLAGGAAVAQAWWAARKGSIKELRAGDAR